MPIPEVTTCICGQLVTVNPCTTCIKNGNLTMFQQFQTICVNGSNSTEARAFGTQVLQSFRYLASNGTNNTLVDETLKKSTGNINLMANSWLVYGVLIIFLIARA